MLNLEAFLPCISRSILGAFKLTGVTISVIIASILQRRMVDELGRKPAEAITNVYIGPGKGRQILLWLVGPTFTLRQPLSTLVGSSGLIPLNRILSVHSIRFCAAVPPPSPPLLLANNHSVSISFSVAAYYWEFHRETMLP